MTNIFKKFKKSNKTVTRFIVLSCITILSGLISLFTISCEIGLGSAVDTLAPTLSIDYPPSSAIIRGTFVVSGSCGDDDTVAEVKVSLRNISTNADYGPYNANITDNSSWSININSAVPDNADGTRGGFNGWSIPDGTYIVSVTVFDGVGRSTGPFTRTIDIDNTAPIFIVKTPTTDSNNVKIFGTSIRISGTVAEKHSVSEMNLIVDNGPGNTEIQAPVSLIQSNVDVSDGAAVDFARYSIANANETAGLARDYLAVYQTVNLKNNGTTISTDQDNPANAIKGYKAGITIADNAKVYNGSSPSGDNAVGNKTSVIYLSDEVYTTLFGSSELGLSADELIACVNGTFNADTATKTSALNTLSTYEKDTTLDANKLQFKLSPSARPTYTINSVGNAITTDINTSSSDYTNMMSGAQVTATVQGFDQNTFVKGSKLKMWLYKLTDTQYGINTIKDLMDDLQNAVYSSAIPVGWTQLTGSATSDEAYEISYTGALTEIDANKYYVVALTGEDVLGTCLYYDGVYIFKGTAYTNPPTINLTSPESEKYSNSTAGLLIEGTAESGGNRVGQLQVALTITNNDIAAGSAGRTQTYTINADLEDPSSYTGKFSEFANVPGNLKKLKFKAALDSLISDADWKAALNSNKNLTYSLTVTATDSNGNNGSTQLQFYVDSKKPALDIKEPSPVVKAYTDSEGNSHTGNFINGKVSVVLTLDDSNLTEGKYQLLVNNTPADIYNEDGTVAAVDENKWYSLGVQTTKTIIIDTTKYADGANLKIKLNAKDAAGNEVTITSGETGVTSKECTIKQETDKPKISVRNANQNVGEINPTNSTTIKGNLLNLNQQNFLNISLEDDDYLSSVELKLWKKGTDGVLSTTPVAVPSGATWSVTTGEITSSKKYDFKPTLAGLEQGIYKVQINVKDSSFDSSATGDAATFQTEKRTALAEFWIIIDNAAPTLVENSTVFGSSENQVLITEGFTLSGTAIDTNAIYSSTVNATYPNATNKGIDSVTISTGTGSSKKTWKADVSVASGATAATPGTWSKEFIVNSSSSSSSAENLADGTYEFTIELKDIAGNTSTLTRNALIDTQKPVFNETRTSTATEEITIATSAEITIATSAVTSGTGDSAVKWYKTTSLDINGKAFDENGIASVKYAKFTENFNPSGLTDSDWNEISYDSATKAWEGTVPSVAHNSTQIAVKLTDTAGNVSYKYTDRVNIDTLVPVRGANSLKVVYGKANSSTGATETTFVDETVATPFAEQVISNKTKEIYVTVNLSDAAAANGNGSSGIDTDNIYLNIGSAFTGTGKPDDANKISTATTAGTAIAYNLVLNSNTATFTIPKEKAADGNVYLRFYDKAGNYTDELLFTIVVDTTAPSASITTPATGSTLNGKKTVKGNSSDNNTAKKFALYYSTTQPGMYTKLPKEDDTQNGVETTPLTRIGSVLTSNINNWTFDSTAANAERPIVDFNTIAGVTYTATGKSKTVYLIPVVWDEAGNCNVYTVENGNANYSYAGKYWTYTVDLDTDRPVIKTTSLSAAGETIKLNADASIEGSVTDDDSSVTAVVQHFIASSIPCTNTNFDADSIIASATTNGGVTTYTNTNVSYTPEGGSAQYDRTEFNAASGTWTYYPADNSDGDKNVYFYIKDNEGMVFYTGQLASGTDPVKMPKFRYKSTAEADAIANDAAITYKSDTQTPVISNVKLQWADVNTKTADYSATQGASYNGPAGETTSVTAATRVGGPKKKYIRLIATAQDANGIDSMKLVLKGNKTTEGPSTPVTTEITAGTGTFGGSFTATSDSTPVTWKTGYIDVSDYDTGTLSITIKAIDKSALVKDSNSQVSIDNTKPEVSNFVPASSTEVTGSFDISGKSTDEGGSTLVSTKWMVPLSGDGSKEDDQLAALPTATAAEINAGGTSLDGKWVPFESASTWSLSLTEDQAKAYDNSKYNVSSDTSGGATLYNIPFWIYAEDGNGNYVISKHTIKHNPDATIPHTQITYPSDSDYDSGRNYITLGGPIRVSGTAADNNSVSSVYLQIDRDAGSGFNGAFNRADALWLASGSKRTDSGPVLKEYEIYDLTDPENPVVMSVADINSNPSNFAAWGIKVSGTTSWGFVINDKGELAPEAVQIDTENNNTSQTNYVRVRACSIDDENHLSAWSETINIAMDNRAPIISSSAKMYQFNKPPVATLTKNATTKVYSYSFANTSTPLSSTTYTKDMFVRNEENLWYIAIQISDEFKLKETDPVKVSRKTNGGTAIPLTASECSASNTTVGSNVFYYANYTKSNGDIDAKVIFIPVMNNVAEQAHEVSYIVSATDSDNTQHTTTSTFQFKIDNDAPVVRSLTDGNEDNLLGAEASPAIDVPVIQNSNNIYNINAKIAESGSGLKNMAFYVSRTYGTGSSAVTKVFDVTMNNRSLAETTANSPANKVNATPVSDLQSITITQTDGTSYSIYGKQFTGGTYSENGTVYTYTKTGISSDTHIRVGGLIYIDGMFRIITAKSGNTVTFDTAATVGTTTAIFPYAHNVYSEGDDGVTSTFTESDNIYSLNAQFNSHNIPDGPVTLHFFFFDNAGNVTCKSVETEIQNNAPRIARLFLGTDLNSNGKYDDGEFNEYMAATIKAGTDDTVEQYKQDFTLTTAAPTYGYGSKYKITNGLAVVPEYTGGNGSLKMVVLNNAATVTTPQTADATSRPLITAQANNNVVTADFGTLLINEDSSTLGSENVVSKYVIANSSLPDDAEDVAMSFTFWDETDGRTQGTDSNYFFVRVTDFDIDCVDDAGPKVVINKFYWAGLNNNSIYNSSTAETVADLKGHIELEKDWNNSGHKTGTTGELDGDPKVSGRIVFTGTAYDEHTLKTLAMTVTNAAGTAITGWNNVTLATYAPATGWTVPAKTLDDNGYKFTLKYNADDYPEGSDGEKLAGFGYYENDVYLSQNGHKVYWELELDTEKFNVANDVTLRIIATDQNNGTTSSTEVTTAGDATKNIPAYRMDIVPYITSVTNSIAAKKPLYARTTLGHYPVYTTRAQNTAGTRETVVVNGFNLKAGYYVVFNKAKTASGSYTNYHSYDASATLTANGTNGFKFTVPADGISGGVVISSTAPTVTTVNNNDDTITYGGVYTLNNLNNKNSRGDYGYSVDEENNEIVDDLAFDDSTGEIGTTGSYDDYINLYNRCPNKKNNNLLTDDLYFDIWDFNTEAANTYDGRNSVLDLMMKIAPGQERIGFAFCDGDEKWAMPGGTGNSYQSFVTTADFFKSTGFTYTSDGKTFGVCAGGESGTNYADTFGLYSSLSGADNRAKASLNGYNSIRIECISQYGAKTGTDLSEKLDKDRFLSPAMAARSVTNGTDLYLAYLDNMNGEIRFRYGNIPNNSNTTKTNHGQFQDSYNDVGGNGTTPKNYSHNTNYFQILATSEGDGLGYAGEYISMGVTSGGVVVIVWYDAKNGALKYSYNTSPTTERNGNAAVGTGWQAVRTLSSHCGKFCQIAVDSENHIHIAAYDTQKADLMYFYLDSYDSTSWTTSRVDSKDGVGEYLTLDVAQDADGNQIPYIGYWRASAQKPCLAYLANPSATDKAGTDIDFYTGTWECSVIPVQSTLPDQGEKNDQRNRINVAVWKTTAGVLRNSVTGTNSVIANGTGSGNCYGNGSANPVLAYRINVGTNGRAETAQKK